MGDDPLVDTWWVALLSAGREQTRRRGGREKTEKTLAGACGSKCRLGSKSTEAESVEAGGEALCKVEGQVAGGLLVGQKYLRPSTALSAGEVF